MTYLTSGNAHGATGQQWATAVNGDGPREQRTMKQSVRGNVVSAVALVVAAALTVSACSSSGTKSGTSGAKGHSGAPAGSSGAAAPSGSTIKIGAVGSMTGSQASSSSQFATVAPAWAKWVNANGGINGHKVQVVT